MFEQTELPETTNIISDAGTQTKTLMKRILVAQALKMPVAEAGGKGSG